MVHEQIFKDPLSSTCQAISERRVLDLESEVLGSIHIGFNILLLVITARNKVGARYYFQ